MNWLDIAASAILMPPEAEPVMPASTFTLIASFTSGLGIWESASRTTRKPGSAAITAPNPYSEAVFSEASRAPAIADLLPSAKFFEILVYPKITTVIMPSTSAVSTDQMPPNFVTSCTTGLAVEFNATDEDTPYRAGMTLFVITQFAMPTSSSGIIASAGLTSLPSSAITVSL